MSSCFPFNHGPSDYSWINCCTIISPSLSSFVHQTTNKSTKQTLSDFTDKKSPSQIAEHLLCEEDMGWCRPDLCTIECTKQTATTDAHRYKWGQGSNSTCRSGGATTGESQRLTVSWPVIEAASGHRHCCAAVAKQSPSMWGGDGWYSHDKEDPSTWVEGISVMNGRVAVQRDSRRYLTWWALLVYLPDPYASRQA
jgi:hypothetical protein